MASYVQSGSSRNLAILGVGAIVAAMGVAAVLAGTGSPESEAAVASRAYPADLAVRTVKTEPIHVPRMQQALYSPQVPAELLSPHASLPVAPSPSANPQPPAAKPDATASIPPATAPSPRKRAAESKTADQARAESASAQLARIKATLKLTPMQERYWPPVEAALRDILTQVGYDSGQPHASQPSKRANAPATIDPERVQRLTSAAMPLLMTFDEAQKREVRRIARIMGLENVASAI